MNDLAKKDYLKVGDFGFDFSFAPSELPLNTQIDKIVEFYKQKCDLIVYNNKIIFSALPNGVNISQVDFDCNSHKIFKSKFKQDCQNNVGTYLNFEIEKNAMPKQIFVLYVINGDICQYSLINAKDNSTFNCFEKFISLNECKVKIVRQVEALENSKIHLTTIEELKTLNATFFTNANVFENANLTHLCINLNEGKALNCENLILKEKNAIATVKNATFANKNDFLPCLTQITHDNKNTTSLIKNFAFVNNDAKVNFGGVNVILKGKTKSNARQETKIYNLSKNAKSVANPQLIIDESDVKASHAVAIGNLDEQSIFYLMSRGIERNKAKEMIILGMVNEILVDIFDDEEQTKVNEMIRNKIKE